LTPDDAESSVSCPGHFNPMERAPPPNTHRKGMGDPIGVKYYRKQKNLCPLPKMEFLNRRCDNLVSSPERILYIHLPKNINFISCHFGVK